MQPLSDAARAAIIAGTTVAGEATVLQNGQPVPYLQHVPLIDGTVVVDRAASYRRTFNVTLAVDAPGQIPTSSSHPLTPFGSELQVVFVLGLPGSLIPYPVTMCTGPITDPSTTDTGADLECIVAGYDRSWSVDARGFLAPYTVNAGQDAVATIEAIISSVFPSAIFNMSPSPAGAETPAASFNEGDGPWADLLTIAEACGIEAFADVNGIFCGGPIPDPNQSPTVWSFDDRQPGAGGMKNIVRGWTRSGSGGSIPNHVIVSGSSSEVTPPVRAEAYDDNPSSPTYIDGPYGDIPEFITSDLVTTVEQAQAAADNELLVQLGSVELLTLTLWPNPAFDVDDVVYVHRGRQGIDGLYVVDAATTTLRHDGQTVLTCRRVS